MKSLKEVITESLENTIVTTVQENTDKQVDENGNQDAVAENVKDKENTEK